MTTLAWSALAVAVLLWAAPAGASLRLGALAGAGRLLSTGASRPRLSTSLRGSGSAGGALALGAAGCALVLAALAFGGVLLAVAAGAVVAVSWRVGRDVVSGRRAAARHRQLLSAVRVLTAEVEAGGRPVAALRGAAQAAPLHAATFAAAALVASDGGDAGAVLAADANTAALGHAWRVSEQTGAALAGVLSRVSADYGAIDEQRRAVSVALAGPRSSAVLLTLLPLLGIGLGLAMGAAPLGFLVHSSAGRVVCCVGVLLDVAGVLWMRRILGRAQRL